MSNALDVMMTMLKAKQLARGADVFLAHTAHETLKSKLRAHILSQAKQKPTAAEPQVATCARTWAAPPWPVYKPPMHDLISVDQLSCGVQLCTWRGPVAAVHKRKRVSNSKLPAAKRKQCEPEDSSTTVTKVPRRAPAI